jgi:hypothetical protein
MRSPLLVMSLEVEYNGAIVSLGSFVRQAMQQGARLRLVRRKDGHEVRDPAGG